MARVLPGLQEPCLVLPILPEIIPLAVLGLWLFPRTPENMGLG